MRDREHAAWTEAWRGLRRIAAAAALMAGALGLGIAAQETPPPTAPAMVLTVEGAIAPAMADHILRNLDAAAERGAPLVVLKLDTPGGLDSSMREIIRAILASPVPVATWVAPSGARAASAGTYILYASHIAAMAPATNLGAATPVAIGGGGGEGGRRFPFGATEEPADEAAEEPAPAEPAAPPSPRGATEAKAVHDAAAYIRGLAELRGRNADWAERAVREAVSLTAPEAAREGVIDFVAASLPELLEQAHGRVVQMAEGEVTLATAGIGHELVEPDWRTAILAVLTNPNVALILMLVGIYGLIFEFLNPGVLVPGTLGGISLILGLYALALLPVNFAGVGLILLGLALLLAEAFAPSFGILGIGGTAALVLGALILVDTEAPGLSVSMPLVAGVAVAGVIATLVVARLAARSWRARVVSGAEEMIGATGRVEDWEGEAGHVLVHGERWRAQGSPGIAPGSAVRVTALEGLTLRVEPAG